MLPRRSPPLLLALTLASAAALGCDRSSSSPDPNTGGSPPGGARTPLVPKTHALYDRFEAPAAANSCASDSACVRSGCSSEVCAAEGLMSSCEVLAVQIPASAACGCVAGECAWFSTDGTTLPASGGGGGEGGGGAPCGDAVCRPEETCIGHYGVAGPSGPMFYTCAIPCRRGAPNDGCPEGRRCVTIADGPGDVCQ